MNGQSDMTSYEEVPFGDPANVLPAATPVEQQQLIKSNEDPREIRTVEAPTNQSPMAMIANAVANGMEIVVVERLMDLQDRIEAGQAKREFLAAMSKFQGEAPQVFRSKSGDKHEYAPIEQIMGTIQPHLTANGLSVRFDTEFAETTMTAVCKVAHIGGYEESSKFTCPIEKSLSKAGNRMMNDSQAGASADSYAKRYALKNAFNIVETHIDNDAESLSAPEPVISEENLQEIQKAAEDKVIDIIELCNWMRVDSIQQIPAVNWQTIHKLIERKYKLAKEPK